MKLLLIGPYPPPHGGISVHVQEARKQLDAAGVRCRVLNLSRSAPESDDYLRIGSHVGLVLALTRHARQGWICHLHTNGHNEKSWLMVFVCGLIGQLGPARLLTIHSGIAPAYLTNSRGWRRLLSKIACRLYDRIIVVNPQIRSALLSLDTPPDRLEELPAYLSTAAATRLPKAFQELVGKGKPLLTTVLFFRPEYGFDLLIAAIARMRPHHPNLRCLVMGSGEGRRNAAGLVRANGLQDAVIFIGDVPHHLCLAVISASNVFIRATLQDGDSIAVREALSLGVPVVASKIGARPAGALLFEAGNVDDLAAKVEAALALPRQKRGRLQARAGANGAQRLLEIYRRTIVQGARL